MPNKNNIATHSMRTVHDYC